MVGWWKQRQFRFLKNSAEYGIITRPMSFRQTAVRPPKCAERCETRNNYHITAQGQKKDLKRLSITDEDIAALIQQGKLSLDFCSDDKNFRVGIEGYFQDFEWFNEKLELRRVEPKQESRVVIEQRSPKNLWLSKEK